MINVLGSSVMAFAGFLHSLAREEIEAVVAGFKKEGVPKKGIIDGRTIAAVAAGNGTHSSRQRVVELFSQMASPWQPSAASAMSSLMSVEWDQRKPELDHFFDLALGTVGVDDQDWSPGNWMPNQIQWGALAYAYEYARQAKSAREDYVHFALRSEEYDDADAANRAGRRRYAALMTAICNASYRGATVPAGVSFLRFFARTVLLGLRWNSEENRRSVLSKEQAVQFVGDSLAFLSVIADKRQMVGHDVMVTEAARNAIAISSVFELKWAYADLRRYFLIAGGKIDELKEGAEIPLPPRKEPDRDFVNFIAWHASTAERGPSPRSRTTPSTRRRVRGLCTILLCSFMLLSGNVSQRLDESRLMDESRRADIRMPRRADIGVLLADIGMLRRVDIGMLRRVDIGMLLADIGMLRRADIGMLLADTGMLRRADIGMLLADTGMLRRADIGGLLREP